MKHFFDSSVLIPAFYKFHVHHASSASLVFGTPREDCCCALRTLGEVYSVMTGLPVRPRVTGREGIGIVEEIRRRMSIVDLSEEEYVSALRNISATIVGGAAYDALIAYCAVKAESDVLVTWNVKDFIRFGPSISRLVKTPLDLQL